MLLQQHQGTEELIQDIPLENQQNKQYDQEESKSIQNQLSLSQQLELSKYQNIDLNIFQNIPQRKRERFVFIKSWEDKRIVKCRILQTIINYMNKCLLERKENAQASLITIIKYMKDRVQQDLRYSQTSNADLIQCYGNQKSINYPGLNKSFTKILELQNKIQMSFNQFSSSVDKEIIQDQLIAYQNKLDKQLKEFKENSIKSQSLLKVYLASSIKKYEDYTIVFTETAKSYLKSQETQTNSGVKDLFFEELNYLNAAQNFLNQLKKYSIETVTFFENFKDIEIERLKVCLEALQQFHTQLKQIHKLDEDIEFQQLLDSISKVDQISEVKSQFEIQKFLPKQEVNFITKDEPTYEKILEFASNFDLKSTDSKQLFAMRLQAKQILDNQLQMDCLLYYSIDRNWVLSYIDSKTNLRQSQILLNNSDVEIIVKKESQELQLNDLKKRRIFRFIIYNFQDLEASNKTLIQF